MSATAKLAIVPAPSDEPAKIRATIRGRTYTFTELSMEKYDELMKRATTQKFNDVTGENEDEVDNTLLMRLMINAAMNPKVENLSKFGVRAYRQLAKLVNDLHYGDEPVKIEDDDAPGDEDEDKGND